MKIVQISSYMIREDLKLVMKARCGLLVNLLGKDQ